MLSIILLIGLFVIWIANFASPQSYFMAITTIFLAAFGGALVLLAIWKVLIEFTEQWWSIIAVHRVRKWLLAPIYLATGIAFIASIGFAFAAMQTNFDTPTGSYFRIFSSTALVLSTGLPLAASALLIIGGLKRIISLRKNMFLFQATVTDDNNEELLRVRASIDSANETGQTFSRPEPKGFFFAALPSKPWYESGEFDWIADFENAYDDIVSEASAIMKSQGDDIEHYGYQGLNTDAWKKVSLVANRFENRENLAACPVTASLLKKIPGYPIFRDAMFSILEPNGVITPHRDYGNVFLTMHFGLIIPPKGFMEVANIRRNWRAGKALVFDSSYNHRAVNQSDEARVILLVDFPNPDLSESERQWLLKAPLWKD